MAKKDWTRDASVRSLISMKPLQKSGSREPSKSLVTVMLDADLHTDLKLFSVKVKKTLKEVLAQCVREFLKNNEEKKGG